MSEIEVTVRQTTGTYIARALGKTASCTAGAAGAVMALAPKVGAAAATAAFVHREGAGRETWTVKANP